MECSSVFLFWAVILIMGRIQVSSIGMSIMRRLILIGISALDLVLCIIFNIIYTSAPLGEKYKNPIYVLVGFPKTQGIMKPTGAFI